MEFLFLTGGVSAGFALYCWSKATSISRQLLLIRNVEEIDGATAKQRLAAMIDRSIPYVAIRGSVQPEQESQLISSTFGQPMKGVILNTTISEHKHEWSNASKSWYDSSRQVGSIVRDIPFGVASGRVYIAVKEWKAAKYFVIPTVSSRFDPIERSITASLVDYAAGSQVKGYTTEERLLQVGSPLVVIGEVLMTHDGKLLIRPPFDLTHPYVLTADSLDNFIVELSSSISGWRWSTWLLAILASGFLGWGAYLYYSAHPEKFSWFKTPTGSAVPLPDGTACVVCMEQPRAVALLDCGHVCVCSECALRLSTCPVCRQHIVRTVRTFVS